MLASLFGASAIQTVTSSQVAVGVTVSVIKLPSALASVKSCAAGATVMEERSTKTRSAFLFTLSTAFHIFSDGAYAWLMKTPEYWEIKGDHGMRRDCLYIDISEVYHRR